MKKALSLILSVLFLLTALPLGAIPVFAATSGTIVGGRWNVDTDGHLTLTGTTAYATSTPPWGRDITSLSIGEDIWEISENAFCYCNQMTWVYFPLKVFSIQANAFAYCDALTDVYYAGSEEDRAKMVIASGNEDLLNATWHYNWVNEFPKPDAPSYLDYNITDGKVTILDCNNGVTGDVVIPDTIDGCPVSAIAQEAFAFCYLMTSITIPDSVTEIGHSTFRRCTSLQSIRLPSDSSRIVTYMFAECTALTSFEIPEGITGISMDAFSGCTSLQTVSLPKSLTTIAEAAFQDCPSLTDVYYAGSEAGRVEMDIMSYNNTLRNATWHYGEDRKPDASSYLRYEIENGTVTIIGNSTEAPIDVLIPATIQGLPVTEIRFFEVYEATSVTLPVSLQTIGDYAFLYCYDITDVYYDGTEKDRAKLVIGEGNEWLTEATWHYAEEDSVLPTAFAGNSVSKEVSGLAFKFSVEVSGMDTNDTTAIYDNATVNGYKLVSMGAIAANAVTYVDIPVVYLYDWSDTDVTFAVRVINIPTDQYDTIITATPYFVLEIDGVATTIYGEAQTASMNGVMNA